MTDDARAQLQASLGEHYSVERELGGGGMSRVFLVHETRLKRDIVVQDVVAKLGETAIEFPPMQTPASFNLTNVKEKIEAAIKAHHGD